MNTASNLSRAGAALAAANLPALASQLGAYAADGRHSTGIAKVGARLALATTPDAAALRTAREAMRDLAAAFGLGFEPSFFGLAYCTADEAA